EYESEGKTKQPYNKNYLPDNYDGISHAARDRYAVVKMIEEVASQFSLIHLKQYCSELMNLVEISEGEIFRFVDDFEEIIAPKPTKQLKSFPISTRYLPEFSYLEADDGKYYISVKADDRSDDLLLKFFI